jgi:O-antigen/teichoic acid export membrane protein
MNVAWNIGTTLLARCALLVLGLGASVVLARTLGPEGRGLLALILLLPAMAKVLGLLGFEQANAVYAGLEPRMRRALVWQSTVMAIVVGALMAAAAAVFLALGAPGFPALAQGPLWLYLLALATVPCGLATEYWSAVLRGMNRIGLLNLAATGTTVVGLGFLVACVVWLRLGVEGAIWVEFLMGVGSVLLMAFLLRRSGAWGRPWLDRSLWRRSARFALPAYVGTMAAYLNYRVDEVIIAAFLPAEQLGFYALAVAVAERLWILPGAVATALLPHLANSPERDPRLAARIARHVMLWTGGACLLVFALADVLIRVLYSEAFAPAVTPLRWLLPGIFALSIGKILVAELLVREKPRYTLWATGIACSVNIAGNLVLVPRLGISGAAIASSVSYSLLSLILIRYYMRECGLSWRSLVVRRSDLRAYGLLWRRVVELVPVGGGLR